MNAKTFSTLVMFAGAAGLAVIAWQQSERARAARLASGQISEQEAAMRSDLQQIEHRLGAAERERAARRAEIDALPRRAVAIPQPKKPDRPYLSTWEHIRNKPDAEAYYLESERSQLAARYGPLFRRLVLSAEATAKFQDIYIKREAARMDLEAVLSTKGAKESGATVAKLRAAAEADYQAAQRELLGEAGYQQLQDYERQVGLWRMVGAIAGAAALEHVPFSPAQAEALVQAIRLTYRNGGGATMRDLSLEAIDVQARTILSAEQFAVFRTMNPPTDGFLQLRMYWVVNSRIRN